MRFSDESSDPVIPTHFHSPVPRMKLQGVMNRYTCDQNCNQQDVKTQAKRLFLDSLDQHPKLQLLTNMNPRRRLSAQAEPSSDVDVSLDGSRVQEKRKVFVEARLLDEAHLGISALEGWFCSGKFQSLLSHPELKF